MQALFLETNTTIKELEKYHYCKNVYSAILLPKRYHEFFDVFSKREADIFPIHCSYNYVINIKNGY